MEKNIKKILGKIKKTNSIDYYRKLGVTIGKNTTIIDSNVDVGHAYLIEIGDNCTLTHCTILAHDASTKHFLNKSKIGIVSIGNDCFVGWGSILLPNIRIGNNCIIGAGTIVNRDIPDNSVVVGNPCRIIKNTNDFIREHRENLKLKPVFDDYWKNKSQEQKETEKELLKDTYGYDE